MEDASAGASGNGEKRSAGKAGAKADSTKKFKYPLPDAAGKDAANGKESRSKALVLGHRSLECVDGRQSSAWFRLSGARG